MFFFTYKPFRVINRCFLSTYYVYTPYRVIIRKLKNFLYTFIRNFHVLRTYRVVLK